MEIKKDPGQGVHTRAYGRDGVLMLAAFALSLAVARQARGRAGARGSDYREKTAPPEVDAVRQVCKTIAAEFAQPLSGALVYSELLLRRATPTDAGHRKELSGVREGILQMERMIETLYRALAETSASGDAARVAVEIEQAMCRPRPRMVVNLAGAAAPS